MYEEIGCLIYGGQGGYGHQAAMPLATIAATTLTEAAITIFEDVMAIIKEATTIIDGD